MSEDTFTITARQVHAGQRADNGFGGFEYVKRVVVIPEDNRVYIWFEGHIRPLALTDPVKLAPLETK